MKGCLVMILCFSIFTTLSASTFISDGVFGSSVLSSERRLLQAKKPCPESFEFKNYTIITSRCKGPTYAAELCCSALKDFACPYVDELNDLSNDCASTMFSYINLYGKYPPGLFASECREGKLGLECPAQSPAQSDRANSNSGTQIIGGFLPVLLLSVVSLTLTFQLM